MGTISVLSDLRRRQTAELRLLGLDAPPEDRVFTSADGLPVDPEHVTRQFKRIAKQAGLPEKRLHDLRHGAASLQLAAGVELAIVSKRLGHSTIALTADTYSHLLEGVGRDAAERSAALVPRRTVPSGQRVVHRTCTTDPVGAVTGADSGSPADTNLQVRAEARGFEPRMGLKSQTALAVRRHRPD